MFITKYFCFQIITTYSNVFEIIVNYQKNSAIPQLHMKTDHGFDCVDIFKIQETIGHQFDQNFLQETSVLYQFCVNKLQVKYCFSNVIFVNTKIKNKISNKVSYKNIF